MSVAPEVQISPIEAYERYIVRSLLGPWSRDLVARAVAIQGGRYLDLACGTGIVGRSLSEQVPEPGWLYGLDVSPGMLAKAESLSEGLEERGWVLEWHEGCACSLPFVDQAFDQVLCQQGLQFFPDPSTALREVQRVLRPGGLLVASVWGALEGNPFYTVIDELVSRHLAKGALARPFALSDTEKLRSLAQGAGLQDVAVWAVPLTVHAEEPERFAAMCLRGATAVLPEFAALSGLLREEVMERMNGDLEELVRPFRRGKGLEFGTMANVLTARA
nr:methyltransferase domain-containing protein [Thioalkalivibrio sp.]